MESKEKLNISEIKKEFDVYKHNPSLIYLDSAATSLKPNSVVEAMTKYYKEYPFSINRGSYNMALKPTELYNETRQLVAEFIGSQEKEVIFTKSTTAAINNIAKSLYYQIKKNDEIIVTNLEHHSNFLPWLNLCQTVGAKLIIIPANEDGKIEVKELEKYITTRTKLIAIHHVSNILGDVVDVKQICKIARKKNILTLIDGAQAAPHMKINVQEIGCDFYTISGHKILGPTGIGILYINQKIGKILHPFEYGGDMVVPSTVDTTEYMTKDMPQKFEAGTPNIAEVIGLGESIKFLNKIGMENIHKHEIELKKYALQLLANKQDIITIYNAQEETGILTFNIKNVAVHDALTASLLNDVTFDQMNIAIRDGQHCNNLAMKYVLQEKSVLRASFYLYNTKEDVEKFVDQIYKIWKVWN